MHLGGAADHHLAIGAVRLVVGGAADVDAVADPHPAHAVAHGLDHAGAIRTRRVGKRRLDRIGTGEHVGVERIHPGRVQPHAHLSRARRRLGQIVELQDVGTAEGVRADGFHGQRF